MCVSLYSLHHCILRSVFIRSAFYSSVQLPSDIYHSTIPSNPQSLLHSNSPLLRFVLTFLLQLHTKFPFLHILFLFVSLSRHSHANAFSNQSINQSVNVLYFSNGRSSARAAALFWAYRSQQTASSDLQSHQCQEDTI